MSCDVFQLAQQGVQGLKPYQPGKPIEELEREYGIQNAVKLASNENPLGMSEQVKQAIQDSLPEMARYPDGNGFILKQALAAKHQVDMDCITLGNGSNDVLELIARVFLTPESAAMYSQHAFAVYPLVTQAIGAKHNAVAAKDWGHDLTAMQAALTPKTRVIFIANPNNPTGTWVNKTELKAFLQAVPEDKIVVVDEAYIEYVAEADYPDASQWLNEFPNLIVTRTFSKAYGLASLRVGYALSHPDITNLLNRVRQPFNVNQFALVAATAALQDSQYIQDSVKLNQAGMQQLTEAFDSMGLSYIPSVGNFIAVDVGQGDAIYETLLRKGVIVRPVTAYQMPQYVRVSIGTEAENAQFIQALKSCMAS
ncbi:histidinol-phosphate transaminase [Candidatus Albibeggiatoa sp. nov. NOAA]|uniref:histidinol-phosphate transaminase n=1 Tax=Candidatus Albibeggiatoa sp. nov. NOAA TaxID=3162724 RepID=UPI0033015228|nr:histidinol-phosphate transaminase [Thiotrichaceae bacterium]